LRSRRKIPTSLIDPPKKANRRRKVVQTPGYINYR